MKRRARPIDVEALMNRWNGREALVWRILEQFDAQLVDDLDRMRACAGESDAQRLREIAHGLKGAAGYAGADEVRAIAAELESLARDADIEAAAECIERLGEAVSACRRELEPALRANAGDLGAAGAQEAPMKDAKHENDPRRR